MSQLDQFFDLFQNKDYTPIVQLVSAFIIGIIFSPWSISPLWFIAFIIAYEIFYAFVTQLQWPYWIFSVRCGVIMFSVLGWLIGRSLQLELKPFSPSPPENDILVFNKNYLLKKKKEN